METGKAMEKPKTGFSWTGGPGINTKLMKDSQSGPDRSTAYTSSGDLPGSARAVIVGGGIVGASVAYHLTKLGWQDVVLLEQKKLAGGTTWHAAGLVGQLRTSNSLTKINKYSVELYQTLEAETGVPTGWNEVGSLVVGTSEERMTQLRRTAAMAEVFGVEAHLVGPDEAGERWPLMRTDDVLGAVWLPHDGKVIPEGVVKALAAGAIQRGATVLEDVQIEEVIMNNDRARGVKTTRGDIQSDFVIVCAGMWSRQLGLSFGVDIPLYPVEHHYIVSEPIEGVDANRPVGRDPNTMIYYRSEDDGSVMLGAFQKTSTPWMIRRVPDDFSFQLLDPDWDRYQQPLAAGKHRIPALENAEFTKFVNGPESFTPDNNFIMGEPPGIDGLFVLTGFNSVGIASAGGAGMYAAEWLESGSAPMDLWSVDIRRFLPMQNDRMYLQNRVTEVLGLHYQMAWPNREMETARDLRRTPLYERLRDRNACFGSASGWERANWFAPQGVDPSIDYSFQKQNWSPFVAEEIRACRENVALFDQSTFSKYTVQGADALEVLQNLCGNNVDVPVGCTVYTGLFNGRGTFESDLTVIRTACDSFYLVSSTAQTVRDMDWIQRHIPAGADVRLDDVTSGIGVVSVMGPNARELLSKVTETDLSGEAFPFGAARPIKVADADVRAIRLTYVGELGWELHIPHGLTGAVYDLLMEAGGAMDVRPAGNYAINAMRLEKAYRAWGHDISPDDTPLEAGLGFAVDWDKEFLGRKVLLAQKESGLRKRLVSFVLEDSGPTLWGGEPIWVDGKRVGYTTSAAFGPTLGAAVALGYVRRPDGGVVDSEFIKSCRCEIENDGVRYRAKASLRAPYDPDRKKILEDGLS